MGEKIHSGLGSDTETSGDFDGHSEGHQSEGISIEDVIKALLESKWLILACIGISAIAAALFFVYAPIKRQGSLDLLPISSFEANKYSRLNSVVEIVDEKRRPLFAISPNSLVDSLADDLRLRDTIEEAIKETGAVIRKKFDTEEAYARAVSKEAVKVIIIPPATTQELANERNRNAVRYWRLKYAHPDKEIVSDILTNAVKASEARIRDKLNTRFEERVRLLEVKKSENLEDIDRQITLEIDQYNRKVENHKAMLNEQAAIARVLDIAKSTLEKPPIDSSGSVIAIPRDNNSPLFMRGYEALEKELALLGERENNLKFIPNLVELQTRILTVKESPTLDRLKAAYAETPLVKGDFRATIYKREWISVSQPIMRYFVPVALLFAGAFIGIFLALLRPLMPKS